MDVVFIDSTAIVPTGPGSPAYFSRFAVQRLANAGHRVAIANGFDKRLCTGADVVVCEWANEPAYEAAASGVCEKLVIRVRGFDMHGPLDQLRWEKVHAVVCESGFVEAFLAKHFPEIPRRVTIPSGVDLTRMHFEPRPEHSVRPIVAVASRMTNDKGLQLVYEWARQRPYVSIDMALTLGSPRIETYLRETRPENVTLHTGIVDVPAWLNTIGATHILSASIWETLGYSIIEGMAVGCAPLIHAAPGTKHNWAAEHLWTTFADLDRLIAQPVRSEQYRAYVEQHYDEKRGSERFINLLTELTA